MGKEVLRCSILNSLETFDVPLLYCLEQTEELENFVVNQNLAKRTINFFVPKNDEGRTRIIRAARSKIVFRLTMYYWSVFLTMLVRFIQGRAEPVIAFRRCWF